MKHENIIFKRKKPCKEMTEIQIDTK